MRSQLDPHPPPPTLPDHRGDGPKKRKRQTTNGTRSTRRQLGRDGEPDLVCCFVESIGIRSRMGSFGGKRSVERLRLRGTRAFGRRDLGTRYPLEGSRRPENFYLGVDYVTSVSHVIIPLSPIDRAYFGPSNKGRLVTPAKSNGHIRLSSDCSLGKGHCSSPSLNEHGEARGAPIGISRQIIGPLLTRGARQRTILHQRPHVLNNLVRTPLPIGPCIDGNDPDRHSSHPSSVPHPSTCPTDSSAASSVVGTGPDSSTSGTLDVSSSVSSEPLPLKLPV
ncbi:hypothetical protein GW17_00044189 [Ensete ventricosum]|nr:hypothetical protein GW17_00044189 [Ensete ventricosum]